MTITVGSLFSGYEGIHLGLTAAGIEHRTLWVADNDKAASTILAHRLPHVPNLGDVSGVDWRALAVPDLLTGGFPCTDVSSAGMRRGITPDTRSGLWNVMAQAIHHMRPRWVLIENVRGLLSARADSDVEPCPWCLGDRGGEGQQPVLRALGAVLGDLSDLGYDAKWVTVAASDVGAAHRRERVFILAWRQEEEPPSLAPTGREHSGTDPVLTLLPTPAGPRVLSLLPTPRAVDVGTPGRRCSPGYRPPLSEVVLPLFKTPTSQLAINGGSQHPDKRREGGHGPTLADQVEHLLTAEDRFGYYGPAVERWADVIGRACPEPTKPGKTGDRLSPRFVEWLMGLPEGWVTDLVGNNDALRALGNGVVPQQLAYALRLLS